MPAPSSTDEFLSLVAKSDLFPSDRLEEFLARRRGDDSLPNDNLKLAQLLVHDGLLTKYQAEQLLSGRWRNFIIGGKYKLLERLGKGGMALVFLCEHQVMKRLVALKILPSAHATDKELLGRFHREARALSQLRHPNIVGAYDADQANKVHFLVMEYVDGGDLDQIIAKAGQLAWERAANYIMQAALGLQHAHECGLVHRDIKPGNLLVDRTGRVKLLDLGLARIFHETTDDLTTGRDAKTLLGTIDYLAPEQALNSHDVDIRADIYSLGATFYFTLTGQGLFEDGSVAQKLSWHLHRPPSPITDFRSDVPPGLIRIIDKMLAKDPEDRYQTPDEVVEALEPYTRTPIDPPSPEELPLLSKAARASANPSSVRLPMPSIKSMVANPNKLTGSTSKSRISTAESSTSRIRTGSQSGINAYDDVEDSAPPIRRGSASRLQTDETSWFKKPKNLAVIAAGTLAILGLGIWGFWGSNSEATPNSGSPSNLIASNSNNSAEPIPAGPSGSSSTIPGVESQADIAITLASESNTPRPFPSLREAIRASKAGDKVIVRGTVLTEALELSDVDGAPRDLTIEGINPQGKDKPVRWRAPKDLSLGRALLDVVGLEGFKLKGFLFDGQGKTAELVRLSGRGSGALLQDLQFEKAGRADLVLRGWAGETSRLATLQKIHFTTVNEAEAAILFETDPDRTTVASESIKITNCRFVGPYQADIEIGGPILGVEIEQCRFFGATDGLRYRRTDSIRNPIKIRVANNTFVDLQRGFHFETTPPASTSDLVIANNVFSTTPRLAALDKVSVQPHQVFGKWIWTDEARKNPSVPPGNRLFRRSFDVVTVPEKATLDIGCDETFTVWLNGQQIFKNPSRHFTQRVFSFNVADKLRRGKNSLTVLATNQLDRLDTKFGTTAGLLAQITVPQGAKDLVLVKTDGTWKWSEQAPEAWIKPEFDDQAWASSKPWPDDGAMMPWKFAVWDSAVLAQLKAPLEPIVASVSGNVRDYKSWDGYPTLDSERGALGDNAFPRNPAEDATFLRYPSSHPLATAGPGDSPLGAFEEK
jgi:serine/threonine protein kinase